MSNITKAFSVDEGILIDEENGGPFITGGTASPVGLDLPTQTLYLRPTASGILIYRKWGAGSTDWRVLSAQDIVFNNSGIDFVAQNSQDAIEEVRGRTVFRIEELTSTLNGNHNIAIADSNIHIVTGSATGYTVTLPDATQLFQGRRFEVVNISSETVKVLDFDGNVLATLIAGDNATFTLENNVTTAGNWISITTTSSATGITSYVVTSNTLFTTSLATDDLITSFTVTPVQGRYAVFYSSDIVISQNNKVSQNVVYVAGSSIENTRRDVQGVGSNYKASQQTIGEVNVNGSQAVDVRVNITSGSLDVNQRSLVLIRLGS